LNGTQKRARSADLSIGAVRFRFFESLTLAVSRAIHLAQFDSIDISDCSFRNCAVTRQSADEGRVSLAFRDCCRVDSTRLALRRCCAYLCKSEDYGQFLFVGGEAIAGGVPGEDHAIESVTALVCGGATASNRVFRRPFVR
jgi:hypothetical protein